jgi:hypothetical protein
MASRSFNNKQALEKEIKSLYLKATYNPNAATVTLPFTTPAVITKAALGSLFNGHTYSGDYFFSGSHLSGKIAPARC